MTEITLIDALTNVLVYALVFVPMERSGTS